jgi:predicted AAA+ superfamily ATPase
MPQILAALRECETHFAILVDFDAEDDTAARNLKLVRDAIAAAKGR